MKYIIVLGYDCTATGISTGATTSDELISNALCYKDYTATSNSQYIWPITTILLMYKGWITEKEWLRYLYIQSFKTVFIKTLTKNIIPLRRKTIKSLSPAVRNHQYGRS